jgi:integrase
MKTRFPLRISEFGVSTSIHKSRQVQNGQTYDGYLVVYSLLGRRKRVWRSDLGEAKAAAREACVKISNGEQVVLELRQSDRLTYLRAVEAVAGVEVPIDIACREYAEARALLGGRVGVLEACRDWLKRNAVERPVATVATAVEQIKEQSRIDRKSEERKTRIATVLGRLANDLQIEVHKITPDIISRWLAALPFAERTRRNYSDLIGVFNRFCILRGYIGKEVDWLDGVQKYRARKIGTISTYQPGEMRALLRYCERHARDMVAFFAIGAFAGLRHSEIDRLDWKQVDLDDGFIEVLPTEGTKAEERRRLVPIKPNLKAWLLTVRKDSGPVCRYESSTKQMYKVANGAGVVWLHNALRHSCISYKVAESGDVARVADESGNSVGVIKSNYLRRFKPALAADWFTIMPEVQS